MILNMSYGASQAQIIDFTVSETTLEVTLPNVILGGNTANGIMLYPTSNLVGNQDGCVYYAWKNPYMDTNAIGKKIYVGAGSEYRVFEGPVGVANPIVYDPTNQTLYIRVSGSIGEGLFPGDYRVVVW